MNYVVAGLLLGRIPSSYTNITTITAVSDDANAIVLEDEPEDMAPVSKDNDDAGAGEKQGNEGEDGIPPAEPALAIVKAAVAVDSMPGTVISLVFIVSLFYLFLVIGIDLLILYLFCFYFINLYFFCSFTYIYYYICSLLTEEELMDDAEADVFLLMMEMLRPDSKLDMAGMWKERIPKLKLRIYQLDR